MLEYLKQLDLKMLLAVNGMHTPFLDSCMLFITHRYSWIPFYVLIVVFLYLKRKREFIWAVFFLIVAVVCSDLFASAFMKPLFQRLRPCHNDAVNGLLYMLKDTCGGKYGFVSSHAANTFALATFLFLLVGKEFKWISWVFAWATLVSLSRVYLGVHYPFDITAGALAGVAIARIFFEAFRYVVRKEFLMKKKAAV